MKTTTIEFDLDDGDAVLLAGAADELGMTLSGYMNHVLLLEIMRTQREEIESLKAHYAPVAYDPVIDYQTTLGVYFDEVSNTWEATWEDDAAERPRDWKPVYIRTDYTGVDR